MKKILIVEGNLREENQSFSEAGIQTHTESLKDSLAFFTDKLETHVVNPSSDENIDKNIDEQSTSTSTQKYMKTLMTKSMHKAMNKSMKHI